MFRWASFKCEFADASTSSEDPTFVITLRFTAQSKPARAEKRSRTVTRTDTRESAYQGRARAKLSYVHRGKNSNRKASFWVGGPTQQKQARPGEARQTRTNHSNRTETQPGRDQDQERQARRSNGESQNARPQQSGDPLFTFNLLVFGTMPTLWSDSCARGESRECVSFPFRSHTLASQKKP